MHVDENKNTNILRFNIHPLRSMEWGLSANRCLHRQPTASLPVAPPAKRVVNPESIKRAKLTRLRKDVALTDEQTTKVKPLIDAYVNDMQAVKNDASLDSRTKRQKLSEVRHKYDTDLDGVLTRNNSKSWRQ